MVAFGISPWLAWFTVASGLLLLTWHTRMQGTWRGLLYFFALLPVLHWLNSINEFLFHEDAVTGLLLARDKASPLEVGSGLIIAVAACVGLVAVIRHRPRANGVAYSRRETWSRKGRERSSGRTSRPTHLPTWAEWTLRSAGSRQ